MWRNRITNDKFRFNFTMWNLCKMGTSINYNFHKKTIEIRDLNDYESITEYKNIYGLG